MSKIKVNKHRVADTALNTTFEKLDCSWLLQGEYKQSTKDKLLLQQFFADKSVLITGGGGFIGSELCRQLAQAKAKQIVIVDIYENNAYQLFMELKERFKDVNIVVEIASIRDFKRIMDIFNEYRPQIVFHAAAHKHVPLMESCPSEAVKNNIIGSYNIMQASAIYSEKFVLVSTDKAVAPYSVMGATKRFCELMLSAFEQEKTIFTGVRLGNVLNSSGSVIPLFKQQILKGGPITLTHKNATRFFMTVEQAAGLILNCAMLGEQSQLMVLDMGEAILIEKLAKSLAAAMGNSNIAIDEKGLRCGEKLHEDIFVNGSVVTKSSHEKIFIEEQPKKTKEAIEKNIRLLFQAATKGGKDEVLQALCQAVEEYKIES